MSDHRSTRGTERPAAAADVIGHCLALKSPEAEVYQRLAFGEDVAEEDLAMLGDAEARAMAQDIFRPRTSAENEQELASIIGAIERDTLERQRARRTRWWRWGAVVVAAAAVVAALILASPREPERGHAEIALGTTYQVDPLLGVAAKRSSGAAGELPLYLPSSTLKITLRPVSVVQGSVAVVGFARSSDGRTHELRFTQQPDAKGVVEITATVQDAGLDAGEWELMFVVGRPPSLPRSWDEAARAEASGDAVAFDVVPAVRLRVVPSIR